MWQDGEHVCVFVVCVFCVYMCVCVCVCVCCWRRNWRVSKLAFCVSASGVCVLQNSNYKIWCAQNLATKCTGPSIGKLDCAQ